MAHAKGRRRERRKYGAKTDLAVAEGLLEVLRGGRAKCMVWREADCVDGGSEDEDRCQTSRPCRGVIIAMEGRVAGAVARFPGVE